MRNCHYCTKESCNSCSYYLERIANEAEALREAEECDKQITEDIANMKTEIQEFTRILWDLNDI